MTAYVQSLPARIRVLFAERFTPELKRRAALFFAASLGIALLTLLVLFLIGATYEPFAWAVLLLMGAAYGWYARGTLTSDPTIQEQWVFYADTDEEEAD